MHTMLGRVLRGLVLLVAASGVAAQVARYDPSTGRLDIPSVSVGEESFTQVALQDLGGLRFVLRAATAQQPAAPGVARFDEASGVVTLPAVQVGADTYLNVNLLHAGGQQFVLQSATPLPAGTRDAVQALFAAIDARWATGVPASGAARMALADACYLHDGRSRAHLVAEADANPLLMALRDAWRIGQRSSNLQVLAERVAVNADRSVRRELDVQYDVAYADGSRAQGLRTTLVSGSSAGTPRCAASQSGSDWRLLGNQRLAYVGVRARTLREERRGLGDGALLSVGYRRELQFIVVDPMHHVRYAVISGPGPRQLVDGISRPFSLKLLSPQLARGGADFSTTAGHYLNWQDDDPFRICRGPGGSGGVAERSDCTGQPLAGFEWGSSHAAADARADADFDSLGFVAGGVYRVALYDDEGWKTVNGEAGRTPLAVYHVTLPRLPRALAAVGASGFPRLTFGGGSMRQVADNLASATPAPMAVSWNAPAAAGDGRVFRLLHGWEYFQGPHRASATASTWPGRRYLNYLYPAATALSVSAWPVSAGPPELAYKTYVELTLQYGDRNDDILASRLVFN